jgi:hypothetical protein
MERMRNGGGGGSSSSTNSYCVQTLCLLAYVSKEDKERRADVGATNSDKVGYPATTTRLNNLQGTQAAFCLVTDLPSFF